MRLRVYDESTSVVDECHKHLHVEQTDNFVNLLNLVRSAPARDNAEDYYERKDRRETEASVEREMSDSLVIVQLLSSRIFSPSPLLEPYILAPESTW